MSIFSIFGKGKTSQIDYPTDIVTYGDEEQVKFTFFKHAAFAFEAAGLRFYVDPVSGYAKYSQLPKADVVLVTHHHYDHLDRAAIDDITTRQSTIICDKTSAEAFDGEAVVMTPGMKAQVGKDVTNEAIPAYNTSEGHTDFHPKAREDNGYVVELIQGLRIYIAGDGEPTPEMLALQDIDIAFLPVNQPYTMTVDQASEVGKTIKPRIFYPSQYGEVDEKTDIERLCRELEGVTDVRVFPME